MVLHRQILNNMFVTATYLQKKIFSVHIAIHIIRTASANLEALPANLYTNAMTAKNLSIILNAIKLYYLSLTLTFAI